MLAAAVQGLVEMNALLRYAGAPQPAGADVITAGGAVVAARGGSQGLDLVISGARARALGSLACLLLF